MLGFIGPYENKLENFIESLSQELDLIHIETQPTQQTRHSFNMYPSLDHLCNAFADLITLFQWKHAAIFYNMETSKLLFQELSMFYQKQNNFLLF